MNTIPDTSITIRTIEKIRISLIEVEINSQNPPVPRDTVTWGRSSLLLE